MLATVVRDVYGIDDKASIRAALEGIASPVDQYGFASTGVYVFFDPEMLEVKYIGLARDLPTRFAQHNGLVPMSATGCKVRQIDSWFEQHDELGYAVFLQSQAGQSRVARQAGTEQAEFYDEESGAFFKYPDESLELIAEFEGQLIEAYRIKFGRLPAWNKIRGLRSPRSAPTANTSAWFDLVVGRADSLYLSRRSIRALNDDSLACDFETALHLARMLAGEQPGADSLAVIRAMNAIATNRHYQATEIPEHWTLMVDGYLFEAPPPPAGADTPGRVFAEMFVKQDVFPDELQHP